MYIRKTFDIKISESLRDLLQEFESQSEVAHLLLKSRINRDLLVETPVNFISISKEDKTKISYVTDERISQIPADEIWTSPRRFQIKPGGFIGKLFSGISPQEVEKFSNLFRAYSLKPKFTFNVVSGSEIKTWYNQENYLENCGSLGNSCMKYSECQKYFDIYTKNSSVKMLIMLDDDGYLLGRSLLWIADLDGKSKKIMDRIYTINDEKYSFYFKKWANDNGYVYKSSQTWYNTLFFESDNMKRSDLRLKVKLEQFDLDYFPYMDTFKFLDSSGYIYNYQPTGKYKTLCSPDGRQSPSGFLVFDSIDKYYRYSGDCVFLPYLDIYTHPDRCYYSEIMDLYILQKDSIWRDDIDDYIFNEELNSHNDQEAINKRLEKCKARKKVDKVDISDTYLTAVGSSFWSRFSQINDLLSEQQVVVTQIPDLGNNVND